MDWSYVSFTIGQGAFGLALLLLPIPFLSHVAIQQRRIAACSPGLAGAVSFLALSLISGTASNQGSDVLGYLPMAGLLLVVALIPLSVRALRNRWVGLLHLFTASGALLAMFLSAMAISHDWL
ncbi:hypothetical protein GCM10027193_23610 [Arenimonas aestuarii]